MPDAFTAVAVVLTPTPERYAKQLLSHLGHKAIVGPLAAGAAGSGVLQLSRGVGVVIPDAGRLVLQAFAATAEDLQAVEDVLARHLVRFGARQELVVEWTSGSGEEPSSAEV